MLSLLHWKVADASTSMPSSFPSALRTRSHGHSSVSWWENQSEWQDFQVEEAAYLLLRIQCQLLAPQLVYQDNASQQEPSLAPGEQRGIGHPAEEKCKATFPNFLYSFWNYTKRKSWLVLAFHFSVPPFTVYIQLGKSWVTRANNTSSTTVKGTEISVNRTTLH